MQTGTYNMHTENKINSEHVNVTNSLVTNIYIHVLDTALVAFIHTTCLPTYRHRIM